MMLGVTAIVNRIIIIRIIPIVVEREHGTVQPLSVITEDNLRIPMRIKDLRRRASAMTTPCGLGLLVKLPCMKPWHARNRTRAAMVVRVWMARLIHHPAVAMVNGIAIAPMIGMVKLVTLP
ncbi:MAG: hypothetical protein ACYTGS_18535 [Planctomycetota bacterium]|jgi:hypothetical protein